MLVLEPVAAFGSKDIEGKGGVALLLVKIIWKVEIRRQIYRAGRGRCFSREHNPEYVWRSLQATGMAHRILDILSMDFPNRY